MGSLQGKRCLLVLSRSHLLSCGQGDETKRFGQGPCRKRETAGETVGSGAGAGFVSDSALALALGLALALALAFLALSGSGIGVALALALSLLWL